MDRIWLKSYPAGVPADIDPSKYQSLIELFDSSIAKYRDRPGVPQHGQEHHLRPARQALARFRRAGCRRAGLAKGARVAIMMPNCLQYPIAMFGILRAGCTVVNVNPLYTPRELEHQLKDSGAEAIVVLENFGHVLQEVRGRTPVKHVDRDLARRDARREGRDREPGGAQGEEDGAALRAAGRGLVQASVSAEGASKKLATPALTHDDIAFLQYTGGTTGVSKGAMLLHRNIIAALQQYEAWLAPAIGDQRAIIITALPLYHIFSLTVNCLVMMVVGGENVLITNPRDIPGFVKELAKHKYTIITGVNTLFNALLNHPDFAKLDFSSVRLAVGGGMAVQKAVAERWRQVTGTPLIEGYGLTETAPSATANPMNLGEFSGSIGVPMPSTEVVLRDDNDQRRGASASPARSASAARR